MGQKVALIHRLLQTDFDILGRISVCEIRAVHVLQPVKAKVPFPQIPSQPWLRPRPHEADFMAKSQRSCTVRPPVHTKPANPLTETANF